MPSHARKRARHETPQKSGEERPRLRAVPKPDAISSLLSGKVTPETTKKRSRSRKKEKPAEQLPEELAPLGDVLAAGRKVEKEIDFKMTYAGEKIRDYCMRRFCEKFAATGHRPDSITYTGPHSRFTFIQTRRISLSPEKAEALRELNVPIDEHTELRGLRINYEPIREHKLEERLREALSGMGLEEELLNDIFQPDVQLKDSFFDYLSTTVGKSLGPGEKLEEKLYDVLQILGPANQIKNPDVPDLTPEECFTLVREAEISLEEGAGLD